MYHETEIARFVSRHKKALKPFGEEILADAARRATETGFLHRKDLDEMLGESFAQQFKAEAVTPEYQSLFRKAMDKVVINGVVMEVTML